MSTVSASTDSVVVGAPAFADAALVRLAHDAGHAAAWRHAVQAGRGAETAAAASGAFAVGVRYDDGDVFLAVDRFAIHTLCYRIVDGRMHFAERADALADATTPLDPQAIYDYLYHHVIPAPRTIFAGVHRVPAGHCVHFRDGKTSVAPYWTPRFTEPARPDFDALRDEFRTLLKAAVARQLNGGKPACFLSGGTDSSTVAGMIGLAAGRPAATYSIGFEAEGYDEMAYARIAARHFGTEHHEYYVTPDDLIASMAAVASSYDQPFGNSSVLPAYYCARMARADGVSRLLAGDGGDELFGGNVRYAKQRVFGRYRHVPAWLRRGVLEPVVGSGAFARVPLLKKGASYVEQARVPLPDRMQMYNLLHRLGADRILTPAFMERIDLQAQATSQRDVWRRSGDATGDVNRMLAFDWRYTLAECDLPKVSGSAAHAGIQVGFPLLDTALVDFSLRLPADYKLKGLTLRWFFKEALRGFLPDETLAKRKQGFGLPFGTWAVRHAGLKTLAVDAVHGLADRGIVNKAFVDELLTTHLQAHPGYYGELVWILTMLELWLRAQGGTRSLAAGAPA